MRPKLHGRAFYEAIGSPKFILAPMVDQSEFAWRMLSRSYLPPAQQRSGLLAYTPMLHARLFAEQDKYRASHFRPALEPLPSDPPPRVADAATAAFSTPYLDGNPAFDRPLFVQFCANDPDHLLDAARRVAPFCDAVDLNLGCPQGIARRGRYGAFLQEDQDLIFRLINVLHRSLPVPVTAKIRVLDTREATLAYARNVLAAGASILTVHGRRREQKGHLTGLADWAVVRWLREQLPPDTVLFANGNVLRHDDLRRCLDATGADGVMSAEGNLSDPAIFAVPPVPVSGSSSDLGDNGRNGDGEYWQGRDGKGGWRVDGIMRRYMDILHRYVAGVDPPRRRPLFVPGDDEAWIARAEREAELDEGPARKRRKRDGKEPSNPNTVAIQAHMFHLLRHLVSRHTDVRDLLARSPPELDAYERVLGMVECKVARGLLEYELTGGESAEEGGRDGEEQEQREGEGGEQEQRVEKGARQEQRVEEGAGQEQVRQARDGENGTRDEDEIEDDPESSAAAVRTCRRPWWIAQPIVRPLPKEALAKGSIQLSKKEKKKRTLVEEERDKEWEKAAEEGGQGREKPVRDVPTEVVVREGDATAVAEEDEAIAAADKLVAG